jgi:hypothetical protein
MRPVAAPNDVPKVHRLVFEAFEATHDALTFGLARASATQATVAPQSQVDLPKVHHSTHTLALSQFLTPSAA